MGMSQGTGMKGRSIQPQQPQGLGSMIGGVNPGGGSLQSTVNQAMQNNPGLPNTSQSGGFDPWAASRQQSQMQNMAQQASQAANPGMTKPLQMPIQPPMNPAMNPPSYMQNNPGQVQSMPGMQKAPMTQATMMPYQQPLAPYQQPGQTGVAPGTPPQIGQQTPYPQPGQTPVAPGMPPQVGGAVNPQAAQMARQATTQPLQLAAALRNRNPFGY